MPKSKNRQKSRQPKLPKLNPRLPVSRNELKAATWRRHLVGGITLLAAVVGLGDWCRDKYMRLEPEVHPLAFDPASSNILSFTVKNRSDLFKMTDVTLSCGLDLIMFRSENNRTVGVGGVITDSDTTLKEIGVAGSDPVNYSCDAKGVLRAQSDGRLRIGGLLTQPGVVHSKLTVSDMCIWVGAKYKVLGFEMTYISPMFEWLGTPTGHEWLEGPLLSKSKTEVTQTCPARPKGPFMKLHGEDAPILLFNF